MINLDALTELATDLLKDFILSAQVSDYRRAFAPPDKRERATLDDPANQPVGARVASWNVIEDAPVSSTDADGGTGFVGGYMGAQPVHIIYRRTPEMAQARWGRAGIQMQEQEGFEALMLALEMTPTRGDLIISGDGQRYVVGELQTAYGIGSNVTAYAVSIQRRDRTDPVYLVV